MKDGSEIARMSLDKVLTRRSFFEASGLLGLMVASGSLLAGCSGNAASSSASSSAASSSAAADAATHVVTDMSNTQVTVPTNISKYAEFWYAHNEIDIMLNKAQGMVMTNCSPDKYPWMYKVCPTMSSATVMDGDTPNFGELAQLGPQVMFTHTTDLRDKCAEVGIPMVDAMFKTFDEMQKSVELTAEVLGGDAPSVAKDYNDSLTQVLADVKGKTDSLSDDQKPKVLTGAAVYELTLDGTGTIVEAWIEACGGKQVVTGDTTGNAQAKYSLEQIIAWDPDFIITDKDGDVESILNDPKWASISAVQKKQVYQNPTGVFMWNRYGVEEILQLQWASKLFHPELFEDVNVEEKVKDFYSKFLYYDLSDDEVKLIMEAKKPE